MMKSKKMKKKMKKKIILGAISVITLLGSTFAWVDYTQHKTNKFRGDQTINDVKLIEDFIPVKNMKAGDNATKEVRVKNSGQGAVFVRLTFKEFMEIGGPVIYTTERYIIDTEGRYVHFNTKIDAETAYPGHTVKELMEFGTAKRSWYVQSQEGDSNGQYGKYMPLWDSSSMESIVKNIKKPTIGEVTSKHHNPDNFPEDIYTTRIFNGSSLDSELFREYFEWNMGIKGTDYVTMADWNGQPTKQWIIDVDDKDNGYVYWGEELLPNETTTNVINSVKLLKQPIGRFNYYLRTKMQAVSPEAMWLDTPDKINGLLGLATKVEIKATNNISSLKPRERLQFTAVVTGSSNVSQSVKYTLTGAKPSTTISDTGMLIIGLDEPDGTIIKVKATSVTNANIISEEYSVTVVGFQILDTFIADGVTWQVVKKDEDGNILVLSRDMINKDIPFTGAGYGTGYDASIIDIEAQMFSQNLKELKNFIAPIIYLPQPDKEYGNDMFAATVINTNGGQKVAFALSLMEYHYIAYENPGFNIDAGVRWTRTSSGNSASVVYYQPEGIDESGEYNPGGFSLTQELMSTRNIGLQPALWLKLK